MRLTDLEIIADEGKWVARIGTDNFFKRGTYLAGETLDSFYEVDVLPSPELKEAKAKKAAEIKDFDTSAAVNMFSLQGHDVWLPKDTRVGLANSIRIEQAAGKAETALWCDGVCYQLPIEQALQLLAELELYALECYNVTHRHLAAVDALTTVEEVDGYDITQGYPNKLVL